MMEALCSDCKPNKISPLSIFGYPFDKELYRNYTPDDKSGIRLEIYQYGLECKDRLMEISLDKSMLKYRMSTFAGQSGCPVISNKSIIGVHVGAGEDCNIGRLITQDMIKKLKLWC
jgi:V8-like Glu-specific endopeptidase